MRRSRDRGRDLVDGGVERGDEHLRLARERALQAPQHDAERDEPLLRAVVQVALDPPPLLIAGLGDPRARGLDLGQLQPQLDAQAGELDRHRGGVEHAAQQVRRASGACSSTPRSRPITERSRPSSGSSTACPSRSA